MNMNQITYEHQKKQRTLSYKVPILLLSIISLVFTVLCYIAYFKYDFSSVFDLISLILYITPCVLFLLYIIKFYNEFKATVIVPLIFGLIAVSPLFYCIIDMIYKYNIYFISLLFDILIIVTFTLAAISALKGFSKKIFLIIAIVAGLFVECVSFLGFLNIIFFHPTRFSNLLGTITFYIALLLFGLNNRIPALLSTSPEKEPSGKADPEQALRLLKDKLDFGMITEEEYQAQRAEIISKL